MKFINKNLHRLVLLFYVFLVPIVSFAQGQNPPASAGGRIENPIPRITSIPVLIHDILVGAIKIGIPVIALAVVYSGFLFVFARGNSEKLGKAKEALMYTLIGAAILLGSYAIANLINATVQAL
ncbi:MAG: hypothetical protein WC793_00100 [Candidatus Paceibacterota bacterium]